MGDSNVHRVDLGVIGRSGDDIKDHPTINEELAKFIPMIKGLVESGKMIPNEVQLVGNGGLESIPQAVAEQQKSGGAGGKFVVKVQSP